MYHLLRHKAAHELADDSAERKNTINNLNIRIERTKVSMQWALVNAYGGELRGKSAHVNQMINDVRGRVDDEMNRMATYWPDAVEKMRGKIGTKIEVVILREGLNEPLTMTIVRDLIRIESVRARAEGDVAYLRITSFSENTYETMSKELQKQKAAIGKGIKGVVLDLRNNPGGLLDQAIAVSDAFLDRGEIVSTSERDPQNTKRYTAQAGDLANGLPMVVLINQGSASASEIVAGALKDHKRAVVLGTKSFGKGSVQTVIPLKDHGAMRLTTARYYTPSGVSIQATGIEPDIMVEPARVERIEDAAMRSESSLRGHLENDQKSGLKPKSTVRDPDADVKQGEEDYQLARALDLIRALSIYNQVLDSPSEAIEGDADAAQR